MHMRTKGHINSSLYAWAKPLNLYISLYTRDTLCPERRLEKGDIRCLANSVPSVINVIYRGVCLTERETCRTCGSLYEAVSISDCTASNVNNDKREPQWLSRYSDCLRAGRPRDRSSSLDRDKTFLSTSSRPVLGPILPPIQWVSGDGPFPEGKAARA
jgi:hypothetical protein